MQSQCRPLRAGTVPCANACGSSACCPRLPSSPATRVTRNTMSPARDQTANSNEARRSVVTRISRMKRKPSLRRHCISNTCAAACAVTGRGAGGESQRVVLLLCSGGGQPTPAQVSAGSMCSVLIAKCSACSYSWHSCNAKAYLYKHQ